MDAMSGPLTKLNLACIGSECHKEYGEIVVVPREHAPWSRRRCQSCLL